MNVISRRLNLGTDRFSGLYLLVLFIVIFGLWEPDLFLTSATMHSVASTYAITAMLGIAALVPLAANTFDLSLGATINLSAIMAASLQSAHEWGPVPSIAVAIAVSVVIGVFNGFLVVKLHVSSFIATLGTGVIITAMQTIFTGSSQPLPPSSSVWSNLTQLQVGGFQIVFIYLFIIALLFWWVLDHTPTGRYLYAVGGNAEAARLSGIRVDKWVWLSLITSATVSGIAGVFYSSLSGPSLTFGSALLLPAFAAAFLGSTQFKPGRFNVWGTVLAVYVLGIGVKGLQLHTGAQWLNDMFNGVALITAVAFAIWRQRGVTHRRRPTTPPTNDAFPRGSSDLDIDLTETQVNHAAGETRS